MNDNNTNHFQPTIRRFNPPKSLQEIQELESPYTTYLDYQSEPSISPHQMQLVSDTVRSSSVTPSATQTAFLQARLNQTRRSRPLKTKVSNGDPVHVTAQIQAQIDMQRKK